jgi:hypothetical protein
MKLLNFTKNRISIWRTLALFSTLMIGVLNSGSLHAQLANTYTLTTSTAAFTPLVGGTATSLAATADDVMSAAFPIGFTFTYEYNNYTQVMASSNGQLLFGTGRTQSAANDLATGTATRRPGVVPLWDDQLLQVGVTYQTSGSAPNRVLTVEWLNMLWDYQAAGPVISYQVRLFEGTNVIEFHYRQEATPYSNAAAVGGASIGLLGIASNNFLSLQNTSASPTTSTVTATNSINTRPATDQIYTFTPPAPIFTPVTNGAYTNRTSTGVIISGSVAQAYTIPTASGIVLGTAPTPTRGMPGVTDSTTSPLVITGSFSKLFNGLTPGTLYYYRTYAENSVGVSYGPDSTFTTNAAGAIANVTKTAASAIGYAFANVGGTIVNDGGDMITASGVVFGTSPNPAIGDPGVVDSTTNPVVMWTSTSSTFGFGLRSLLPSTKYYYRAYAINASGTGYSTMDSFTTTAAIMTTGSASGITTIQASLGGSIRTITGTGNNASITKSGIVLGTSASPSVGDPGVTDSSTTPLVNSGAYSKIITGLAPGVTYHYRAYAINPFGTFYGGDSTFTTNASASAPSVNKTAATAIGYAFATVGGTIVNDGGDAITASGVVFGTAINPSIGDPGVVDSTTNPVVATASANFTFGLRNLAYSTKYYYRAYAINAVGTTYSTLDSFTTTAAIMTTGSTTFVTTIQATIGGSIRTITGTGNNASITRSGILLGTSADPTYGDPAVTDSATSPLVNTGSYTKVIKGLVASTLYHYRAYVVNPFGVFYGADSTFTTAATETVATIIHSAATNKTDTSASISANIQSDGGSVVIGSGIVYSTTPHPVIGDPGVVDSTTTPAVATGAFTINPAGLTHSTKYYVRAYAINGIGTAYSVEDSFYTAPIVSVFPYTQNFDAPVITSGWASTATGGANVWAMGTPAKTFINSASSAPNCWITSLTGNYPSAHNAAVVSPKFDMTAVAADPIIEFKQKFRTEAGWDGAVVEISINGGTWTKLDATLGTGGNFNTPNSISWYNSSSTNGPIAPPKFSSLTSGVGTNVIYSSQVNGWINSRTILTGAAGQADVKVRIRFGSDGSGEDEGYAFDDITVFLPTIASVNSGAFSNLTTNSATLGGNITGNGNAVITRSGIVYSTTPAPVIGDPGVVDSATSPNVVNGAFTVNVTGLSSATLYYYRAFATNGIGTAYGADSTFTTNAVATAPTVTQSTATNVSAFAADISANIPTDGGDPVTVSGIVYSTSPNPTIGDPGVVDSATTPNVATGAFTIHPGGLTQLTKYYHRAYAINAVGTSYSNVDSFTTTYAVSAFPYLEDFEAGANNWTLTTVPTFTNNWVLGTPAKTFITGAHSGINAWTTKLIGTYDPGVQSSVVSPQLDFSGKATDPMLSFYHKFVTEQTWDAMIVEISVNGGAWSKVDPALGTGGNFNTANSYSWYSNNGTNGPITPPKFSSITTGVGSDALYSSQSNGWIKSQTVLTGTAGQSNVRIRFTFGSDGSGQQEGWALDDINFGDSAAPAVITGIHTNITTTLATLNGAITNDGFSTITASGIVYGTAPAPVIGDPGVVDSVTNPVVSTGTFNINIGGLLPATTYFYRAYAINATGTTYGADSSFTTNASAVIPTVLSSAATTITGNSAILHGNITSDGGDPVTASGVVYSSTSSAPAIGDPGVIDSATSPAVTTGTFSNNIAGLAPLTQYYFRAYAINAIGTAYSAVDSFTTGFLIDSLPYAQDFEAGADHWSITTESGSLNNWILGTPAKTFITGAHSGVNAWVTNLVNDYDPGVQSSVVSPQFDLTGIATDPILRFSHKFVTEGNWDALMIQISVNGGPWTKLDDNLGTGANFNTPNSYAWYNHAGASGPVAPSKFSSNTTGIGSDAIYASQVNGWIQSAVVMTGAAGFSNVKVRFFFGSDGSGQDEGWALDDFEIEEVITPTTPASAVILSNVTNTTTDVAWTNGNGKGRLVVARLTPTPAVAPTDNTLYSANNVFAAQDSTGPGNYIVYHDVVASVVSVSGLADLTNYTYDVYEYNGKYMHIKFTTAASNNATTPVKLTSFTATAKAADAFLNWTTASEINNKGFDVERSVDGRTFESIGFVKGAGNSTRMLNYSLTDAKAFTKTSSTVLYYRLKQVDFDGTFAYSNVVKVNSNAQKANALSVYPNPFNNAYNVSFDAANAGMVELKMVDIQGKVVAEYSAPAIKGENKISLDNLSNVSAGVYFVKVTVDGETQVLKLVKN